jgi:hypothetical protein
MPHLIKAKAVRCYAHWLTRENKLNRVLEQVPKETAALIQNPPLPSTWVEAALLEPVFSVVERIEGDGTLRRMSREALRDELLPPLRHMVSAFVRLLGASPETIYRHLNDLIKTSVVGLDIGFTPTSTRSGVVVASFDVTKEIPGCIFIALIATLEVVLEICGATGTVSDPVRDAPAKAHYQIEWSSRRR